MNTRDTIKIYIFCDPIIYTVNIEGRKRARCHGTRPSWSPEAEVRPTGPYVMAPKNKRVSLDEFHVISAGYV